METTILTKTKQPQHFSELISLLVAQFKPLQIYQFAQWSQQEQCNSIFIEMQQQEQTVYYLMLVTESSTRIENAIQDFVNQHYVAAKAIVLAHGEATLKQNPRICNEYFKSVLNRGFKILL